MDEDTYYHAKVYLEPVSARQLHQPLLCPSPQDTTQIIQPLSIPPATYQVATSPGSNQELQTPEHSPSSVLPAFIQPLSLSSATNQPPPAVNQPPSALPVTNQPPSASPVASQPPSASPVASQLPSASPVTNQPPSASPVANPPPSASPTASQATTESLIASQLENTCKVCGVHYAHRASLFKHMRKLHPTNQSSCGNIRCQEEACNFTCRYLDGLRSHLETVHSIPMEREEITFGSFQGMCNCNS